MVKTIQENHKVKPTKLIPVVGPNVRRFSLSTIYSIMRESDLERFLAFPKPFFTALHRRK